MYVPKTPILLMIAMQNSYFHDQAKSQFSKTCHTWFVPLKICITFAMTYKFKQYYCIFMPVAKISHLWVIVMQNS